MWRRPSPATSLVTEGREDRGGSARPGPGWRLRCRARRGSRVRAPAAGPSPRRSSRTRRVARLRRAGRPDTGRACRSRASGGSERPVRPALAVSVRRKTPPAPADTDGPGSVGRRRPMDHPCGGQPGYADSASTATTQNSSALPHSAPACSCRSASPLRVWSRASTSSATTNSRKAPQGRTRPHRHRRRGRRPCGRFARSCGSSARVRPRRRGPLTNGLALEPDGSPPPIPQTSCRTTSRQSVQRVGPACGSAHAPPDRLADRWRTLRPARGTPPSSTSTKPRRAAALTRGKSQKRSRPRCGPRSGFCADGRPAKASRGRQQCSSPRDASTRAGREAG